MAVSGAYSNKTNWLIGRFGCEKNGLWCLYAIDINYLISWEYLNLKELETMGFNNKRRECEAINLPYSEVQGC